MPLATRDATVSWNGTLAAGAGELRTGGGAASALPMDWESRSEQADGTTSPEELLAASLAGCYAMQLALVLQREGIKPDALEVHGTCELDRSGGEHEFAVTKLTLEVEGDVPDVEAARFEELARTADEECPVANALRGSVEVTTTARLSG